MPPLLNTRVREETVDVSVVIPTCRRPGELREAIDSVLNQRAVTVQVLVVDDDPDGSAHGIVSEFADDRVTYRKNRHPTYGRPATVRNLAWPHTNGRFLHFMDDDDRIPPDRYLAAKEAFACEPDVGVVFGSIAAFGVDAALVEEEQRYFATARKRATAAARFGPRWGFSACMYFGSTLLVCSAALIRRECVAALGGFDSTYRISEDVEFYARAIRQYGAAFVDQPCLQRRVGPSLIRQRDADQLLTETYERMQADYRNKRGRGEYLALKVLARTVLQVL